MSALENNDELSGLVKKADLIIFKIVIVRQLTHLSRHYLKWIAYVLWIRTWTAEYWKQDADWNWWKYGIKWHCTLWIRKRHSPGIVRWFVLTISYWWSDNSVCNTKFRFADHEFDKLINYSFIANLALRVLYTSHGPRQVFSTELRNSTAAILMWNMNDDSSHIYGL